jgi:hypothetical protein
VRKQSGFTFALLYPYACIPLQPFCRPMFSSRRPLSSTRRKAKTRVSTCRTRARYASWTRVRSSPLKMRCVLWGIFKASTSATTCFPRRPWLLSARTSLT